VTERVDYMDDRLVTDPAFRQQLLSRVCQVRACVRACVCVFVRVCVCACVCVCVFCATRRCDGRQRAKQPARCEQPAATGAATAGSVQSSRFVPSLLPSFPLEAVVACVCARSTCFFAPPCPAMALQQVSPP